jgi:hypothetical protein
MDLEAGARERQSDVVRGLSAHGNHDTRRIFEGVDVHDGLEADVFEVQAVGFVVICKIISFWYRGTRRMRGYIPVDTVSGLKLRGGQHDTL